MDTAPKLMAGSVTGPSYLMIGRRGQIALGIKMLGLGPAPTNKELSYMACRLRSAPYGQDMEHAEQDDVVVSMEDHSLTLTSAWPEIKFEKVDSTRASAIIGFLIRGNIQDDPVKVLKAAMNEGHIEKLVDFVIEKAGADYMVLRKQLIVDWAKGEIQPQLEKLETKLAQVKEFTDSMEDSIGIAGFQAEQMKKLYQAMHPEHYKEAEAEAGPTITKAAKEEPVEAEDDSVGEDPTED